MPEMIERLARVLATQDGEIYDNLPSKHPGGAASRSKYDSWAITVVQHMRKPTTAMIAAIEDAARQELYGEDIWQAGIDQATAM